jgi:hypothetical protein
LGSIWKITWHRRYLSVISASGCETIVMNQTALKNSDQNVSQYRSCSRDATGAVAIDPLLQNGRRLEHDHATRRNRQLGAGVRDTTDMLTFLEIFSSWLSPCRVRIPDRREMRITA